MTSLAQQMASTAESAQDVLKEQARLEAEKQKAKAQEWYEAGIKQADTEFPEIIATIKDLSQKGKRQHSISIQSMDDSYGLGEYQSGRDKRLKELLTENGFKYTTYEFEQEPVGSDPISWNTLYYYGLDISW
jgi:hypothetical protein